ncbi:MAG: DNA internalization-related competence protein ComEC/Rec2, partial [Brachymonas sp.]|nr:DNA internalization-related competence protein ComEC/Rec2 [Brachymonas sp.]
GWGVPAQRTSIMLLAVAVLRSRGLVWPWHAVLAWAAVAVLLADPWALMQAGFWLSFVAVAVLFATSTPQPQPGSAWRKVRDKWLGFFRTQGIITAVLAPLTLLLFGQVSVVGFVANALAVPLVTFVVTPLALLGVAWAPLWQLAAWVLNYLMQGLQTLSALSWANYHAAAAPWWVGVAGVAGGLLAVLRLPLPWRLSGALALVPVLLWQAPRPAPGHFDLLAADVGQGSAVLVRTRHHSLLFDAGPRYSITSNAGERVLLPLLLTLDETPEWLVLSHEDTDHVGGAEALVQAYPQLQLLGAIASTHPLQAQRPVVPCVAGQHWRWDGVDFRILHPLASAQDGIDKVSNSLSCVLHISNGKRSALLPGDVEVAQESAILARLAEAGVSLQADVLLAGHHGSKTSTSAEWLAAVQPRLALVQQGYANRYQHPHPSVVQRLQQHGVAVHVSEACGAAWWRSDDNTLYCERIDRRRYWQHPGDPYMAGSR